MKLDARLSAIYAQVDKCKVVADIGSDHGKLGYALLEANVAEYLIAIDISVPSLDKTTRLLTDRFAGKFEVRAGDGLVPIVHKNSVEQVVIAGIGGREIGKIILSSLKLAHASNALVLQPMRDVVWLRGELNKNNFKIVRDLVVKDGHKYYHILKVVSGAELLTPLQLAFGAVASEYTSPAYQDWLEMLGQKYHSIITSARQAKTLDERKIKGAESCLNTITELKNKE